MVNALRLYQCSTVFLPILFLTLSQTHKHTHIHTHSRSRSESESNSSFKGRCLPATGRHFGFSGFTVWPKDLAQGLNLQYWLVDNSLYHLSQSHSDEVKFLYVIFRCNLQLIISLLFILNILLLVSNTWLLMLLSWGTYIHYLQMGFLIIFA